MKRIQIYIYIHIYWWYICIYTYILVAKLGKRSQYFFPVLRNALIVLWFIFHIFLRYLVWSCYILRPELSLQAAAMKRLCPQCECLSCTIAPTSETMCRQLSMSCKLLQPHKTKASNLVFDLNAPKGTSGDILHCTDGIILSVTYLCKIKWDS